MSAPENILESPLEAILGTKPVALVWVHPESAYAYAGLGDFNKADAAAALRDLAASLDESETPSPTESTESTDDFTAVLSGIHTLAMSSPAASGETTDYQRGWDEAMAAVAAIAATYEPAFAYQASHGHLGWIEAPPSQVPAMERMDFSLRRRAVGPWESHPKGAGI